MPEFGPWGTFDEGADPFDEVAKLDDTYPLDDAKPFNGARPFHVARSFDVANSFDGGTTPCDGTRLFDMLNGKPLEEDVKTFWEEAELLDAKPWDVKPLDMRRWDGDANPSARAIDGRAEDVKPGDDGKALAIVCSERRMTLGIVDRYASLSSNSWTAELTPDGSGVGERLGIGRTKSHGSSNVDARGSSFFQPSSSPSPSPNLNENASESRSTMSRVIEGMSGSGS